MSEEEDDNERHIDIGDKAWVFIHSLMSDGTTMPMIALQPFSYGDKVYTVMARSRTPLGDGSVLNGGRLFECVIDEEGKVAHVEPVLHDEGQPVLHYLMTHAYVDETPAEPGSDRLPRCGVKGCQQVGLNNVTFPHPELGECDVDFCDEHIARFKNDE